MLTEYFIKKKNFEVIEAKYIASFLFQVYQQFPCSFEFNEKFLITVFEHAYSSQFGKLFTAAVEPSLSRHTLFATLSANWGNKY